MQRTFDEQSVREQFPALRRPYEGRKDDKYLELAVSGGAECIVSGDRDLLALNPFRGIQILTPDVFLDQLSN